MNFGTSTKEVRLKADATYLEATDATVRLKADATYNEKARKAMRLPGLQSSRTRDSR